MINSIGNVLSSPKLNKVATGATATVLIMTGLKAVGRPAFIYADKKIDSESKKYTATKEFLYQMLCLGITFAALPIFKKGGVKLAEKVLNKTGETSKEIRQHVINGGNEAGALTGSVVGLTIVAPLISHEILHPSMKAIGLEKKGEKSPKKTQTQINMKV